MAWNWGQPSAESQWRTETLSPKLQEKILPTERAEVGASSLKHLDETPALTHTLTAILWDTLKQRTPARPCPDSWPTEIVKLLNEYYIKSLHVWQFVILPCSAFSVSLMDCIFIEHHYFKYYIFFSLSAAPIRICRGRSKFYRDWRFYKLGKNGSLQKTLQNCETSSGITLNIHLEWEKQS